MATGWNLLDVVQGYEDCDPIRERALAYPLMFSALGLGRPERGTVLDYGCGTGTVAERTRTDISHHRVRDAQRLAAPPGSVDPPRAPWEAPMTDPTRR